MKVEFYEDNRSQVVKFIGDVVGYVSHNGEIHAVIALLDCIKSTPLRYVTRIEDARPKLTNPEDFQIWKQWAGSLG